MGRHQTKGKNGKMLLINLKGTYLILLEIKDIKD